MATCKTPYFLRLYLLTSSGFGHEYGLISTGTDLVTSGMSAPSVSNAQAVRRVVESSPSQIAGFNLSKEPFPFWLVTIKFDTFSNQLIFEPPMFSDPMPNFSSPFVIANIA